MSKKNPRACPYHLISAEGGGGEGGGEGGGGEGARRQRYQLCDCGARTAHMARTHDTHAYSTRICMARMGLLQVWLMQVRRLWMLELREVGFERKAIYIRKSRRLLLSLSNLPMKMPPSHWSSMFDCCSFCLEAMTASTWK